LVDPVKKKIKMKKHKSGEVDCKHNTPFWRKKKKIVRFVMDKSQKLFLKYRLTTFLVQIQIAISKFYFELVTRTKHLQVRSVQVRSCQVRSDTGTEALYVNFYTVFLLVFLF
jgi:hypothetical protein